MPRSWKLLPLLVPLLLLVSCKSSQRPASQITPALSPPPSPSGSPTTSATDPLCAQVKVVKLSQADTVETIAAVIANNAAIRAVCGN